MRPKEIIDGKNIVIYEWAITAPDLFLLAIQFITGTAVNGVIIGKEAMENLKTL